MIEEFLNQFFGGAFAGTAIAFLSAWLLGIFTFARNSKQRIFESYAQRYANVVGCILNSVSSFDVLFDPNSSEQRKWAVEYWMLVSEEQYLCGRGLIDKKAWTVWEEGLVRHLEKPFFSTSWKWVRQQCDFEGEFANYIDKHISVETSSKSDIAA